MNQYKPTPRPSAEPVRGGGTSNIERPTPNVERERRRPTSALDARCSELDVRAVPTRCGQGVLAVLAAVALSLLPSALAQAPPQAAAGIVAASGMPGGVCVVVGEDSAELALATAKLGSFTVHVLCSDGVGRDRARARIRDGAMGGSVAAVTWDRQALPYPPDFVNLLVVDAPGASGPPGVTAAECSRVLTPLGSLFVHVPSRSAPGVSDLRTWLSEAGLEAPALTTLGGATWLRASKQWPASIDEWTHFLHGADGNPVAQDTRVGPPQHYQWVSDPLWMRSHESDSSISTLVTARGRLFAIVDEAPISLAGQHDLPDKWALVARDAFNGMLLWRVPIRRWGWREWKETWFNLRPGDIPLNLQKRLVAAGDKVYVTLGYPAPVSQLDARTGDLLRTYAGTERTNEILLHGDTLVLSVLRQERVKLVAVSAVSGSRLWESAETYGGTTTDYYRWRAMRGKVKPAKLDPSLNTATDGKVVALIDGPDIVCLNFTDGAEKWRKAFPQADSDRKAGGIKTQGKLWIGTMIVTDGVVVHASPGVVAGFSAADGTVLWQQPKRYIGHLWYEWKDVFVIDGLVWTWGEDLKREVLAGSGARKQHSLFPQSVKGYDIHTGEIKRTVPLGGIFKTHHHHRCYRNKATVRYILASRRGTEYVDIKHGKHTVDNWVRGICHLGMMPANGLQYAPPHPCACYGQEKLNGMNALAPAYADEAGSGPGEPRLVRGPAADGALGPDADPDDWPEFRHDGLRTGSVPTSVDPSLEPTWRAEIGRRVSPPVVVGERIYAALVDEHRVVCLDAGSGRRLWDHATGGRIDSPPTYWKGRIIFGSADASVACLRATDGALAWRFVVAARQRFIGAFDQLESAWPVPGSVLVQNGTAYFCVGRTSQLDGGMWLYGLDAATGDIRHQTSLQGPRYTVDDIEENFRLPEGALPDILMSDGSVIVMRGLAFTPELKRTRGGPDFSARAGLRDDTYFKRMPWTRGGEYGRLLVRDKRSVYYVRMFDSMEGLNPNVYFTPGVKGYLLFAKGVAGKKKTWTTRIPARIRAMVQTDGHLFVAGPPDVVDPKDPLGSFEGRKGGRLYTFDSANGEKLAELDLPSPPVFNGIAAARGSVYVADEAGGITRFSSR